MNGKKHRQVAALPWRKRGDMIEVLLVTTRSTRRWVIPKGWPMTDKADHQAAAQEAFEEAGVRGTINLQALGQFRYNKVMASGENRRIAVTIYDLAVTKEVSVWPEQAQRERRWMSLSQAMQLASDVELVPLLLKFAERGESDVQPPAPSKTWRWASRMANTLWQSLRNNRTSA